MARKIVLLCALSLFLAIAFTGCYDKREVNDMAYVLNMGFDKGVADKLRLSLQIIAYKGGAEGGGNEKGHIDGTILSTVDCPSVAAGLNRANAGLARRLNLSHAKLLVFSDEMARSGEMERYLDTLARDRETQLISHVIVTRGKAEDFLRINKPVLGTNPVRSVEVLLGSRYYTGFFPRARLLDFYRAAKSPSEHPVAILAGVNSFKKIELPGRGEDQKQVSVGKYIAGEMLKKGGHKRELLGAAVFRGTKMVGEINGDEVRAMDMIRGEFTQGFFVIPDPKASDFVVALDVHQARKPRIKVNIKDGFPEIDVKIRLEGDIVGLPSEVKYENSRLKPVLERAFARDTKVVIDNLLEKCQLEFRSDIFGFGYSAASQFGTLKEWEEYKWLEKFPSARINTSVDFIIRRAGMLLKSMPILPGKEGEE